MTAIKGIDGGPTVTRLAHDQASQAARTVAAAKARHNLSAEVMDQTPGARDGDQQAMVAAKLVRDELYSMLGLSQPAVEPAEPTPAPVRVVQSPTTRATIRPAGDDTDWRPRAACCDQPPELFFPLPAANREQIEEAKAVCRRCPVADQCRQWALDTWQQYGIWGGMTEDERLALLRRNRTAGGGR